MDIDRTKKSLYNLLTLNSLSNYGYVTYINNEINNIYIDLSYRIDRSNVSDLEYLSNVDLAYAYQEKYIRVYRDNDSTYINGKFTKEEILSIFEEALPYLKSYNFDMFVDVKVGDFFGEYRNDKLVDIHRVAKIYDKEYVTFSISHLSETDYLYPSSNSFTYMIDNDYRKMTNEEVLALVVDIEYQEILNQLHNRYTLNNFNDTNIGKLMSTFRIHNNDFGDFKLFRVTKNNEIIYNPFGNFVFSGHKKIILPKVI